MKYLPLLALLLFAGCSKDTEDPRAAANGPLVGHWEGDVTKILAYDGTGKLVGPEPVRALHYVVDATTAEFHQQVRNSTNVESDNRYPYYLAGEDLQLTGANRTSRYWCRGLTATGWTYEVQDAVPGYGTRVTTVVYHH